MSANISAIGLSGFFRGPQLLLVLSLLMPYIPNVISVVEYSVESFLCFLEYLEGYGKTK